MRWDGRGLPPPLPGSSEQNGASSWEGRGHRRRCPHLLGSSSRSRSAMRERERVNENGPPRWAASGARQPAVAGTRVWRRAGRHRRGCYGGGTRMNGARVDGKGAACSGFLGLLIILGQNFHDNGPKTSRHWIIYLATDDSTQLLIYSNGRFNAKAKYL